MIFRKVKRKENVERKYDGEFDRRKKIAEKVKENKERLKENMIEILPGKEEKNEGYLEKKTSTTSFSEKKQELQDLIKTPHLKKWLQR